MLDVFKFIFQCVANIFKMLFDVDLGFMSLGSLMCCIGFGVPAVLLIVNFLKEGEK